MKNSAFHLNQLKDSERRSSSPVRLRVILPTLAFFTTIAMALWWASIFAQQIVVQTRFGDLTAANDARKAPETDARNAHLDYVERTSELSQLDGYAAAVRRIGPALAALAEYMPLNIQLISISISELPPQNLKLSNPKMPLMRGPTNTAERQVFTIDGRTAKALHARNLKQTLETPAFAPIAAALTRETSRVDSSAPTRGEARATLFHLEYAMPPRSFVKQKEETKTTDAEKEAAK